MKLKYKRTDYDFELVSCNVKMVHYQNDSTATSTKTPDKTFARTKVN
ncbi:MAG: hypothetical protein ABEH43_03385 [Flavobacteriales bacterium]